MTLKTVFQSAENQSAVQAIPDGSAVSFVLEGAEGGEWTIRRVEDRLNVLAGIHDPIDCSLYCSVDDFLALVDGRLQPSRGFMEGKLKVQGDVGLILSLKSALSE